MSALQSLPRLSEWDVLRSTRHTDARSARDLADWLAWLELGGTAPRTLDAYERTAAALLLAHPAKAFDEFTDGDLMHLLRTYPEKSRRIRKAHLASWFRWGYRTRRIPANPVELLPVMKRPHQPVIDLFTDAEVERLRSLPSPDGHLMTVLFWTGIRKSEARNLTARRLDFQRELVIVSEGAKGSKDRVVPMFDSVATALTNLLFLEGIGPNDYLWYDKPGGAFATKVRRSKPIGETSFGRWWTRCIEEAEVRYLKPHTTRHQFATTLKEAGVPIEDIQALLGHASVATTSDLYVHSTTAAIGTRVRARLDEVAT